MKTRRALQIIVGIISAMVLLCLIAGVICWGLWKLWPETFSFVTPVIDPVISGFSVIAALMGIGELAYIVPLVACVLPMLLLLIATILLFSRYKGKMGKYTAGVILALIGIAILTLFTIVFASDLAAVSEEHVWFPSPVDWAATDMIVRYSALGLLAISLVFIGCALGVKNKKQADTQETAVNTDTTAATKKTATAKAKATTTKTTTAEPTIVVKNVGSAKANDTAKTTETAKANDTAKVNNTAKSNETAKPTSAAKPTKSADTAKSNDTAADKEVKITNTPFPNQKVVINKTVSETITPATRAKINKARRLYEMGVITQKEYLKIEKELLSE